MKARILNKIWQVMFVSPSLLKGKKKHANSKSITEDARGDCDAPTTKNKTIRISNSLLPQEELEVTIHEALHAADWYKDEEWITPVADDIARLLYNLGWRKVVRRPDERKQ